jgi:hypothetical protein
MGNRRYDRHPVVDRELVELAPGLGGEQLPARLHSGSKTFPLTARQRGRTLRHIK